MDLQSVLAEIDTALVEFEDFRRGSIYGDCSDKAEEDAIAVTNRLASTIDRWAPPGSIHKKQLEKILATKGHSYVHLLPLKGTLIALRREYELGQLRSFSEIVRADTFASFLEMADHLHGHGFKDAAAVIAGSVLEQHLRELCNKSQIAISSNGIFTKADALNSELSKKGIYGKLDQKNVTSWLGLRNEAAHGHYQAYTIEQVRLMIDAVQNFMARYPA